MLKVPTGIVGDNKEPLFLRMYIEFFKFRHTAKINSQTWRVTLHVQQE